MIFMSEGYPGKEVHTDKEVACSYDEFFIIFWCLKLIV